MNTLKWTLYRPADQSGAYTYRIGFPQLTMKSIFKTEIMRFIESTFNINDINLLKHMTNIVYQKPASPGVTQNIKIIKKLCDSYGIKLIADYDDIMKFEDLPKWNEGGKSYKAEIIQSGIKDVIENLDIMTVTTDTIKDYYVENYNIDKNRVKVIPNFLPRWWIHPKTELMQTNTLLKKRPKILLPLSSSHYSHDGSQEDDFSHIVNFIRNTTKKYEWTFVSEVPFVLRDLAQQSKITIANPMTILNYPRETLEQINPCMIIAPLKDNKFNRCKSEIKIQEAFGMGVPIIAQDLPMYNRITDFVFKDENSLQNQINRILKSKRDYSKIIKTNKKLCDSGSKDIKHFENGFWLENNIQKWIEILVKTPQKTITYDLRKQI